MLRDKVFDYFSKDNLATDVFISKYSLNKQEVPDEMHERLAEDFARIEEKYHDIYLTKDIKALSDYGQRRFKTDNFSSVIKGKIVSLFNHFDFIIPGGSVMQGLGSGKPVSLSNCYVLKSPDDDIESIFNTARDAAQIYKRRGGVGLDISNLRPRGAGVDNSANSSTGAVSFMELYSTVTSIICQEGRRGALMISIDVNHPDVFEFANVKKDLTKITGANISIRLNEDFLKAVKEDSDYILRYPCETKDNYLYTTALAEELEDFCDGLEYNKLYNNQQGGEYTYIKRIRAKELWDNIVSNAHLTAEPGIFNWDRLVNYDPTGVYDELKPVSTNPCVTPDTKVLTSEGFIPIINLVGKEFDIWNGKRWSKVKPFKTGESCEVYKVKFSDGSDLNCTPYHKFILKDNKRKQLSECMVGDKLEKFNLPFINFESPYIYSIKDWYTQGFFSGDGFTIEEGGKVKAFSDLYAEKILLKDELNCDLYGRYLPEVDKQRVQFKNIISTNKELVPINYDAGDRLAWLSGLIDSDGTLNDIGGSIAITSINRDFLYEVKTLLITLGISSCLGINKEEQVKIIKGKEYLCQPCYRLTISSSNVRKLIQLGLSTNRVPLIANPSRDASRYITITSIELLPEKSDTYCLEEFYNHSCMFNHVVTGQCGELGLSGYDSCRLIATNLYSLVENPFTNKAALDTVKAYEVFYEAQVLADNLVDLELEAVDKILNKIDSRYNINWSNKEKEEFIASKSFYDLSDEFKLWWKIREIGSKGRRTGTGITAYADMLAALSKPYGNEFITDLIFNIKLQAELDASIDMAIIRGPFPLWNKDMEFTISKIHSDYYELSGNNEWYQYIVDNFPSQALKMYKYSRRNAGLSTIAPTGSVSILTQTSSGIEPVFMPFYVRRVTCHSGETPDIIENGIGYKEVPMIHPKLKTWYNIVGYGVLAQHLGEGLNRIPEVHELTKNDWEYLYPHSPYYLQDSASIDYNVRVDTQALIQKYITSSISSTVNLPKDVTKEVVEDLYLKAFEKGCKGITVNYMQPYVVIYK